MGPYIRLLVVFQKTQMGKMLSAVERKQEFLTKRFLNIFTVTGFRARH